MRAGPSYSCSTPGSLGQNVCPASDTKRNLRTVPNLWASKAVQPSVRLSDINQGIATKVEDDNYGRIPLEEEQEEIEGKRGGERKRERRWNGKRKTFEAFLRRTAGQVFSYPEQRLGD